MAGGSQAIAGAEAQGQALRAWQAVRGAGDIQYGPVKVVPPDTDVPAWLRALGEFLKRVFGPLGRWLGVSWPTLEWVLIGLAALLALFLLWRLLGPWLFKPRHKPEVTPDWVPDQTEAHALLDDADRLAAAGQYDAATHLLLRRSVQQIAAARPEWIRPASTAREIAALQPLSDAARAAFATISGRVERSRYAMRALTADDWQAARAAYAQFALVRIAA